MAAGAGGAGEADHVDVGVAGERLSDLGAVAGDQVHHPGGQPSLVQRVEQQVRRQGGDLAGFHHDGAAGGQRGGELDDDLVQRVVPGGDRGDDPDWFPHDQAVADPLLGRILAEQVDVGGDDPDRQVGLDPGGDSSRRPHLGDDRFGDRLRSRHQSVVQPPQVSGPLTARRRRPAVRGGAGGGHRRIHICSRPGRNGREHRLRRRVLHSDRLTRGGLGPPPVHIDCATVTHSLLPSRCHPPRRISGGSNSTCALWIWRQVSEKRTSERPPMPRIIASNAAGTSAKLIWAVTRPPRSRLPRRA